VAVGAGRVTPAQFAASFEATYFHALAILAVGFATVMALHPRLGLNPRGVWTLWLLVALGLAVYGLWLNLTGRPIPTWLLGFALGWMFSTLAPTSRKRR
jgi:hypothetical protein